MTKQFEEIGKRIAAGEAGQYEAAILWQELERLGSGEPPQPRCPKCSKGIYIHSVIQVGANVIFECSEGHQFRCYSAEQCAQFFGPSAPSPQPPLKDRIVDLLKIASGTEGWPTEDQVFDYVKALLMASKTSGVAPSGSAGQEPPFCDDACDAKHGIHTAMCHLRRNKPEGRAESAEPPKVASHLGAVRD